jgi:hypothetical protein
MKRINIMKMQRVLCVLAGLGALAAFGCGAAPEATESTSTNTEALKGTLAYEAELTTDIDEGVVKSGCNASGGKYVDLNPYPNMLIWQEVAVPTGSSARSVSIRYSLSNSTPIPFQVALNGTVFATSAGKGPSKGSKVCTNWVTETFNFPKPYPTSFDFYIFSTKVVGNYSSPNIDTITINYQ